MTTLDPTTIPPGQLQQLLSAWSAGHLPDTAAVGLLTAHGFWLGRRDFLAACVDAVDDAEAAEAGGGDPAPVAAIVWTAIPAFAATARASSGELAVLQLAVSLAGVDTGSLADLTAGLGPNTLALVLDAIAARAGWPETGRTHQTTGRLPAGTPEYLRPALTRLQDLTVEAQRRRQTLQDRPETDPEPADDRLDLAPVTVTVTDYQQVLTHPRTAPEASKLLATVSELARHVGYTLTLGVDLTADPAALDWLAPGPAARTIQRYVPAAAGWDPHGYRATAAHAAAALRSHSHHGGDRW